MTLRVSIKKVGKRYIAVISEHRIRNRMKGVKRDDKRRKRKKRVNMFPELSLD